MSDAAKSEMNAAMNASQMQPPSIAHPSDIREIVQKQLGKPIAQKPPKVSFPTAFRTAFHSDSVHLASTQKARKRKWWREETRRCQDQREVPVSFSVRPAKWDICYVAEFSEIPIRDDNEGKQLQHVQNDNDKQPKSKEEKSREEESSTAGPKK